MRNIISIIIGIRSIVCCLDACLLLLLDVFLGELDEFLTSCVHLSVVFVIVLVTNSTLNVWPSCIQEDTSCIFNLSSF
jgi:hypothetical protein